LQSFEALAGNVKSQIKVMFARSTV